MDANGPLLTNSEIADRLMSLSQMLAAQKENAFKVKAYRRAAKTIRDLPGSLDELVRHGADLTEYSGIGKAISSAIREMVLSGTLRQLESLRTQVSPELAAISEHPKLDPARVLRIYKKLKIASVDELKQKLTSGEIASSEHAWMRTCAKRSARRTKSCSTRPKTWLRPSSNSCCSAAALPALR